MLQQHSSVRVAVVIPCYNEEAAIGTVVRDFRLSLPDADIIAFDNNSRDNTARVAREAGARVISVPLQGKGNVVRRMFADVEADVFVMVDGDATYDAAAAPMLIELLIENHLDMVVGSRLSDEQTAYRLGHRFGNVLLTRCAATIFGKTFKDMLSGYRVFSRRYAKTFPVHSAGFEIETELAVHALSMRMPVAELETSYKSRPEGSESKLNTYRDGFRILLTILKLFKAEKPLAFFTAGFVICMLLSVGLAVPVFETYVETGLVPRIPTVVLSIGLMLLGAILLVCGIVLDTVTRGRNEIKRIAYLAIPALQPVRSRE
ncbi:glycosyltransferase family 2 protein [Caballeronia ptereochthonis]|uniref:Undecaprenyl-phosphate 4-deoxy-4-formamido-L-arabinose transferase n=1 Tax=Caballeronia ptereochthonis TaxID=1777144 RepID=A0A158DUL7_9BURK|nr:glycosyltransferase family 2 protein [Caballeronia ptereochthonis]SAK98311.1 Undecaprenyl-phosphate 4-deoxy-4-formamido-L-arabinose transferase [Caballeronia ptereochthonis]